MRSDPRIDALIRAYGDELRGMTHAKYAGLVGKCCPACPATESAIRLARDDPERRLNNVCRGRVLAYLRQQETGEGAEVDLQGMELG